MSTAYTVIKDYIETKLNTITKIETVYDYPRLDFEEYPAATIIPTTQTSVYQTMSDNERMYNFDVSIFYDVQMSGIETAIDAIDDLVDDVLDLFDTDEFLTGISLPVGYEMIAVEPTAGEFVQTDDKKIVGVTILVAVRVVIDLDS